MSRLIIIFLLLVTLGLTAAQCGVWVESLEIEVAEDLTSNVTFIVRQSENRGTSDFLKQFETMFARCQFKINWLSDSRFSAIRRDIPRGELVRILECYELSTYGGLHSVEKNNWFLGIDYKFQIDLHRRGASCIRQVKLTMPGKIQQPVEPSPHPNWPDGLSVTPKFEEDTVVWEIGDPSEGCLNPFGVQQAPAVVAEEAEAQPPGITPTAPSNPAESSPAVLTLSARTRRYNMDHILSVLGVLLGSGIISRLLWTRRKE